MPNRAKKGGIKNERRMDSRKVGSQPKINRKAIRNLETIDPTACSASNWFRSHTFSVCVRGLYWRMVLVVALTAEQSTFEDKKGSFSYAWLDYSRHLRHSEQSSTPLFFFNSGIHVHVLQIKTLKKQIRNKKTAQDSILAESCCCEVKNRILQLAEVFHSFHSTVATQRFVC